MNSSEFNITLNINDIDQEELNITTDINDTTLIDINQTWYDNNDYNLTYSEYHNKDLNLTIKPKPNVEGIVRVTVKVKDSNNTTDTNTTFDINISAYNLVLADLNAITLTTPTTTNLTLPLIGTINTSEINWSSNNTSIITTTGTVNRGSSDTTVTLTATAKLANTILTKDYTVVVTGNPPPTNNNNNSGSGYTPPPSSSSTSSLSSSSTSNNSSSRSSTNSTSSSNSSSSSTNSSSSANSSSKSSTNNSSLNGASSSNSSQPNTNSSVNQSSSSSSQQKITITNIIPQEKPQTTEIANKDGVYHVVDIQDSLGNKVETYAVSKVENTTVVKDTTGAVTTTATNEVKDTNKQISSQVITSSSGESEVKLEVKDTSTNKVEATNSAKVEIAGSKSEITDTGITSSIKVATNQANTQAEFKATLSNDGSTSHVVGVINTQTNQVVESKATSNVAGSSVVVSKEGTVKTSSPEITTDNGTKSKSEVNTDVSGKSVAEVVITTKDNQIVKSEIKNEIAGNVNEITTTGIKSKVTLTIEESNNNNNSNSSNNGTTNQPTSKKEVTLEAQISTDGSVEHVVGVKDETTNKQIQTVAKATIAGSIVEVNEQKQVVTQTPTYTTPSGKVAQSTVVTNQTGESTATFINGDKQISLNTLPDAKMEATNEGLKAQTTLTNTNPIKITLGQKRASGELTIEPISINSLEPKLEINAKYDGSIEISSIEGLLKVNMPNGSTKTLSNRQTVTVNDNGEFLTKEKTIEIKQGWNLIGTPVNKIVDNPTNTFNVSKSYKYISETNSWEDNPATLNPGEAIWVYNSFDINHTVTTVNKIELFSTNLIPDLYPISTVQQSSSSESSSSVVSSNQSSSSSSYPIIEQIVSSSVSSSSSQSSLNLNNLLNIVTGTTTVNLRNKINVGSTWYLRSSIIDITPKEICETYNTANIYTYNTTTKIYDSYSCDNNTTLIKAGDGYWIKPLKIDSKVNIKKGWNLVSNLISNIQTPHTKNYTFDTQSNEYKINKADIKPNEGYWIYSTEDTTISTQVVQESQQELYYTPTNSKWNLLGTPFDISSDNIFKATNATKLYIFKDNEWSTITNSDNVLIPSGTGFWAK